MQRCTLPVHSYVLRLDGDATLALEVHRIEVLGSHVSSVDSPGELEDAVGKGGLAVINVRNDRKIANFGEFHGLHHPTDHTHRHV